MATTGLNQVLKPKTRKGKKILEKREPQLVESIKVAIFIRGATANDRVTKLMRDLCAIKRPNSIFFGKKNDWRPFEDATHLEFMSLKNDAPLFMFGSHSKKRPDNLVIGRTFDNHILDMVELGVENFQPMTDFKTPKISVGCKPVVMFSGQAFETQHEYERLKNLFLDFFSGPQLESIRLAGLENVISLVAHEGKILFRHYRIMLKKSGSRLPRVEVEEIGPRFDMTIRRKQLASDDLYKSTLKKPHGLKPKKVKNVDKSALGTTYARVHMERQDYNKLTIRRMKGLRRGGPPVEAMHIGDSTEDKRAFQEVDEQTTNKRVKFSQE